MTEQLNIL